VVRGLREGLGEDPAPHIGGVEPELTGDLVEVAFEGEAGLRVP